MITRRDLIKNTVAGIAGLSLPLVSVKIINAAETLFPDRFEKPSVLWGFVVDTYKCVGCGLCVKACKNENEIPYNIPLSRTWVERYLILKDGRVLIDSPDAGRDGYTNQKVRDTVVSPENIAKAFFVPKLCNQCENPPCVQVCPVGATYKTTDGVILIDRKWCIGCGYCIQSCPYGVRFFHPVYKVAEKCTFCYHRITKGMKTACVEACPFGARQIGNLRDRNDPVAKIVLSERVAVLKDAFGTKPQVYYIGLDENVR
ncbi:MAG: 4Fe-4S dicluster domain-containing protein [Nitrospirae bacterium]|nr:4Fe-4S dicluster domain-containing protein [Nitrospirota bacterium]